MRVKIQMILTIVLKRMSVDTAKNTEIWTSLYDPVAGVCTGAPALSQAPWKHIAIECFLPLARPFPVPEGNSAGEWLLQRHS